MSSSCSRCSCASPAPAPLKPRTDAGVLTLRQPGRGYRYSLDPFLLADFCQPRRGERILDLGAGVGVIGLLLARRHSTVHVTGIEREADLARCAAENARANSLEGRCRVIRGDVRDAPRFLPAEHFHRVVANPPFRRPGSGAAPPDPGRARARQELTFSLADLARTASALLRYGGSLCTIHLAERLPELWRTLDESGLEPKVLRLVAPHAVSAPRLCLVTAVKGGRPGLSVMPQLVIHEPGGRYTGEVAAILNDSHPAAAHQRQKTPT
jgi:tRNA1Val (adenine37-N6)-methyltransferase